MQLEDWVKKDMTRFIKDHEPEIAKSLPTRQEDLGVLGKIDYERHIKRALEQNRFAEATKHFNEVKEHFLNIPLEHQQERKQFYRILQKCYKLIYDYVEDRHKTSRLLGRIDDTADVFDDSVAPVNLKEQTDYKSMMPTIEEVMFRKKPQMPAFHETVAVEMPQEHASAPTFEMPAAPAPSMPEMQPVEPEMQSAEPEMPKFEPPTLHPHEEEQIKQQSNALKQPAEHKTLFELAAEQEEPVHEVTDEEAPSWLPPSMTLDKPDVRTTESTPFVQEPPTPEELTILEEKLPGWNPPTLEFPKSTQRKPQEVRTHETQVRATTQLIADASAALKTDDTELAQTKLIEARIEYYRSEEQHPHQLREIESLERQLSTLMNHPYVPPMDNELFSSLYIRGVHAMNAGDYEKAAELFAKRVAQAPYDVAAKIRYTECTEVLDGKAA